MSTYTEQIGRTIINPQSWTNGRGMAMIEWTIEYTYPDAGPETLHLRASLVGGRWTLRILSSRDPNAHTLQKIDIHPDVIERIYSEPGAADLIGSPMIHAWLNRFYADSYIPSQPLTFEKRETA